MTDRPAPRTLPTPATVDPWHPIGCTITPDDPDAYPMRVLVVDRIPYVSTSSDAGGWSPLTPCPRPERFGTIPPPGASLLARRRALVAWARAYVAALGIDVP